MYADTHGDEKLVRGIEVVGRLCNDIPGTGSETIVPDRVSSRFSEGHASISSTERPTAQSNRYFTGDRGKSADHSPILNEYPESAGALLLHTGKHMEQFHEKILAIPWYWIT